MTNLQGSRFYDTSASVNGGEKHQSIGISVVQTSGLGSRVAAEKKQHSGFMLISVDTPYYSRPVMTAYCQWAKENLDKFRLVVVDMPQAYNYSVRRGMQIEQARSRTEQIGEERKRGLRKIVRKLGADNFSVIGFTDLEQEADYQTTRGVLTRYLKSSTVFESDVLEETGHHVKTMKRERESANFFLDEVAASLYLSEFGDYPIEVAHQPEFDVVRNIYKGKYRGLLEELGLQGNIGYIQVVRGGSPLRVIQRD